MGQKVNPLGFRVGVHEPWRSRWHTRDKRDFQKYVVQDAIIRKTIDKISRDLSIVRIDIERNVSRKSDIVVIIHCAQKNLIVGKGGSRLNEITNNIVKQIGPHNIEYRVQAVKEPLLESKYVADQVAIQLEKRMAHRRVMHRFLDDVMNAGAKGIKIQCKGRIGGTDIARKEDLSAGSLPLSSISAKIDVADSTAHLVKGTIGIKVWIYLGDMVYNKARGEWEFFEQPTTMQHEE